MGFHFACLLVLANVLTVRADICPDKDSLSEVLLENNWKTQAEIVQMTANDQRNEVITKITEITGHTVEDLSNRPSVGHGTDLGSLTAIANFASVLIKYSIRSSEDVKKMKYQPDLRNTLIVEIAARHLVDVNTLQGLDDQELLQAFCSACPVGWTSLSTGCYLFNEASDGDYEEAKAVCQDKGGFLAEINGQEEQETLWQFCQDNEIDKNIAWWLGASDKFKEGEWKWEHTGEIFFNAGQTVTYDAFSTGEPNNVGNAEDCLVADSDGRKFRWVDIPCDTKVWKWRKVKALCEYSQTTVTCPHKDDLSDVLLENNWRTQNQINTMSENMQRNTVIVEVEKMTGHTIEDLRGRANAGDLGSLTAIANMAALLIKKAIKSSSDVETMTYSDLRNTLIGEASQRFSIEVSILQSMTDRQLLKTFCTASTPKCGGENQVSGSKKTRISGGRETINHKYPWMVFLPSGCGGSLITDRHVLTAKHCVPHVDKETVKGLFIGKMVKIRVHDHSDRKDYQEVAIKDYDWTSNGDLAIIILAPVDLNHRNIGTVCLPDSTKDYLGEKVSALGWGWTHVTSSKSSVLREVDLTVKRQDEKWLYTKTVFNSGGVPLDFCTGDSGGPLVLQEAGRWTIIGVLDGGGNCMDHYGTDGKSIKITDYLEWINNKIKN